MKKLRHACNDPDTCHYWNLTRHIFRYHHRGEADAYNGIHTINEGQRLCACLWVRTTHPLHAHYSHPSGRVLGTNPVLYEARSQRRCERLAGIRALVKLMLLSQWVFRQCRNRLGAKLGITLGLDTLHDTWLGRPSYVSRYLSFVSPGSTTMRSDRCLPCINSARCASLSRVCV